MSLATFSVVNSINMTLSHKYTVISSDESQIMIEERETGQIYKIEVSEVKECEERK